MTCLTVLFEFYLNDAFISTIPEQFIAVREHN